jgi:putative MATE family efflux protein
MFMEPLLRLLGASDNTMGYASQYTLWVIVIGGIPSTLSMTMAHLLRSEGYAKQASIGLSIGGILNIILDPLFMFVILTPGLEVTGAAVATMLSNVCSLIYFCAAFYVLRNKTVLSVSLKNVCPAKRHIRSIFAVGLPSALGTLLACLSNTVINKLSSGYGDIPVASMGIVKKIDMLPMNVGMGLCQGMMPLVAYNYSAKNYKRMKQAANSARIAGICFAGICIVVFQLFTGNIIRLFINEKETITLATSFLRIACIAVPFTIVNVQMSYTFQAIGKGPQSLLLSSCRQGIINIPLMFLMNTIFGRYGVIWTQTIADSITLIISFMLYRQLDKVINAKMKVQGAS